MFFCVFHLDSLLADFFQKSFEAIITSNNLTMHDLFALLANDFYKSIL